MSIPVSKVKIHGRSFTIEETETLQFEGEPQMGLCDVAQHKITILKGPDAVMADTVFHELVHAACPALTEEQVLDIEQSLFGVLVDNQKLTKWLFKKR